jgi:hypothetical protein
MKSNIDSEQVKKIVIETVEKALEECAFQHQVNIEAPDDPNDLQMKTGHFLKYKEQPFELRMTLLFHFGENIKSPNMPGMIYCQPIIDLTGIEGEE